MGTGIRGFDISEDPIKSTVFGTKEDSPVQNAIDNEAAPRTQHVRKKRTKPGPLSIERVLPSYVVLLNDGRPVIMRRATSTDDARRKVQAMIDEGKL